MRNKRQLSDAARAAITQFSEFPVCGQGGRAWTLAALPEAELRLCELLISLNEPNAEFWAGITDAILLAACLHHAPPKRASNVRRDLQLIEKWANVAATALQQLSAALNQTTIFSKLSEPIPSLIDPLAIAALQALGANAREIANRVESDSGGRARLTAFLFIRLLADAFVRATGNPAALTWSEHRKRYEGRFWELIERVLRPAEIAAGGKFAPASNHARGRQVQAILTAMEKTDPSAV